MSLGFGKLSLGASTNASETSGSNDVSTTGVGVGYKINDDISIAANVVNSEDDMSDNKLGTTSYSFSYTIAPSLNFAIAMNQYSYDDASAVNADLDSDEVRASIQASF